MRSFFMEITEKPIVESVAEEVSLAPKEQSKVKNIKAPKVELSENIRRFDEKVKIYKENPYSFNQVALKKDKVSVLPVKTADQMITEPTYNAVGKLLGVDTVHDWNKYYDKVYTIVEWAKKHGVTELDSIVKWLGDKSREVPSLGSKRIDDLYFVAYMAIK